MPPSFHFIKYQRDKQTNEYLRQKTPRFRDWEIITLFYSALHLIESYLGNHGHPIIPKSHQTRENLVEQYLKGIFEIYSEFYILCKTARYDALVTDEDLDAANDYYIQIKQFIEPII